MSLKNGLSLGIQFIHIHFAQNAICTFAYNMGDRWIWMCLECFHGETDDEHFYELTVIE